jgi:ABC-2 type transport system ATP-binding protein
MLRQDLPTWNGTLKNNLHFTAAIHGIKGQENEDWVDFILESLGLKKYMDATWKQISGGFRTRYSLARALVQRPNLLALDEPLANLDINTQLVVLSNLKELAVNFVEPLAILISSQHLHEIESISDKIIFLRDGETIYNGLMKDFERERAENIFELVTDAGEKDMLKLLKPLGVKGIEQAGGNYLVKVAVKIEAEAVLRALLDGGVKIALFRDISQSTRKLFRVEK